MASIEDNKNNNQVNGQAMNIALNDALKNAALPEGIEDKYPLSPLQQGMLFHTLRDRGVGMYISQAVSRYENLDPDAMRQAWQQAVDHHPILRTSFHWDDPENPEQQVHRQVDIPFQVHDWRGLSPAEQNTRLRQYQREEREQGFDLNKPCLLKVSAIQVSNSRWYCVNSHHHIILDGWSGGILGGEIARLYESIRRGRPMSVSSARPFGDYIRWIEAQDLNLAEAFWRRHLNGVTAPTPLPADQGLSKEKRIRLHVESWSVKFGPKGTRQLDQLARACKVTLNCVVQSAWAWLLSRYSGEQSVLFGSLVSGRPPALEGVESIVGMFLNTVPFRVTVEPERPLDEWLRDLHLEQVELQSFEYSPLMLVQQWSDIGGGVPLFESIVARKDVTQSGKAGVTAKSRSGGRGGKAEQSTFQQNYPMLLNIMASEGVELKMTYDARRFRNADIARMMEQLRSLLLQMSENPRQAVGELSLLSADERQRVLYEWHYLPQTDLGRDTLSDILGNIVLRHPDTPVMSWNKAVSFQECQNNVAKIRAWLQAEGLKQGDVVALSLPLDDSASSSVCWHVFFALLQSGITLLPMSGQTLFLAFDKPEEWPDLAAIISDTTDFDSEALHLDENVKRWTVEDIQMVLASTEEASALDAVSIGLNDAVVICYEVHNGLWRHPVLLNHRAALNSLATDEARVPAHKTVPVTGVVNSVVFWWQCWSVWHSGATVWPVTMTNLASYEDRSESVHLRLVLTPSQLNRLLGSIDLAQSPINQCRKILLWGEDDYCSVEPRWREYAGETDIRYLFVNHFGGVAFVDSAESMGRSGSASRCLFNSIGNTVAYVLDEHNEPCPIGVAGELVLAGDGLLLPSKVGDSLTLPFQKDAFHRDSERLMARTGIMARWRSDGALENLGRKDQQYEAVAGKANLSELSRVLRQFPEIRQAASVIRDLDGDRVSFVVSETDSLNLAQVRNYLLRHLPRHALPERFVLCDALPLDVSGRLDIDNLAGRNDPGIATDGIHEEIMRPVSELEKTIAEVFMDVLKIERISTGDSFFELGGHSLSATKATARLTKILKSDIPLKGIFEAPTVKSLAEWIQSDKHQEELPYSIEAAERGSEAPLTYTQQQLWVLGQLFPNLPTYTIPSNTLFNGHMDVQALHDALRDLIERHEILRTTFISRNGEPLQVVNPIPEKIDMEMRDVSDLAPDQRMEAARNYGAQLGKKPWDFERGPLVRPQLVRMSDQEFVLNTAFHHIIADGPSMAVFCAELGKLYNAHVSGKPARLSPLPLQFSDFAIWERENVKGALFTKQLNYWRGILEGAELLEIPTDFPRPAVHGFFGKKVKFDIPKADVARMQELGRTERATTFMSLLAVYQLLLHRYSGLDDVLIGSAMTNRIRVELERLIGLFVNTIPLRVNFAGDPTFREVLGRVRDCCMGAFANMDLPFEETIAQIQPTRDLSRQGSPIFQFMLIHNPAGAGKKDTQEGQFRPGDPHNDTGHANFDLLLSTRETHEGVIKITMAYDTELFRAETIDRLIGHMQRLYEAVTQHPDIPISQISMAGDDERQEVLVGWNGKEVSPSDLCVHQMIDQWAHQSPEQPALVFGDEQLSYADLQARSNQYAHALMARGVQPETFVGVCLPRSFDLIIAMLGTLKAGGAFVTMDPAYPPDRLRHILGDTQCPVLITDDAFDKELLGEFPKVSVLNVNDASLPDQPASAADVQVQTGHLAYVIYTSGSTGVPKGVMVEHHNLASIIRAQIPRFGISQNSHVLQMLSMSFDAALGEVFRTLVAGGTLYMADKDDLLPGPVLVDLLKKHQITAVAMSPTALSTMPDVSDELVDLQTITVGGEACNPVVAAKWGQYRQLLNGYGPTETTIGATLGSDWDLKGKPPLGRPLDGVKVYVLDAHRQPVPVGVPGELFIGGVGVTRGYLNRDDLTAKSFFTDPFSLVPGARMYRTGDLVRWLASGMLDFLGRVDQQVKIRGFRIELGEIETVLVKHSDIEQCAVNVHESNGVKRLIAYLVYRPGKDLSVSTLRQYLKDRLPEYMVPAMFMALDQLPMNNSGKVDKKALPIPDVSEVTTKTAFVEPRNDTEKALAELWGEVLGLPKVGVNNNFFELGGDSISAIRVAARINETGRTVTPKDIFMYQTVAELAASLDNNDDGIRTAV